MTDVDRGQCPACEGSGLWMNDRSACRGGCNGTGRITERMPSRRPSEVVSCAARLITDDGKSWRCIANHRSQPPAWEPFGGHRWEETEARTTSEEREAFLKLEEVARGMTPGGASYMKCISDALQQLDTARHVNHGGDDRDDMPICRKVGVEKNVGQWTVTSDNGRIRVLCEDEATARRIGDMLTQKRGNTA